MLKVTETVPTFLNESNTNQLPLSKQTSNAKTNRFDNCPTARSIRQGRNTAANEDH